MNICREFPSYSSAVYTCSVYDKLKQYNNVLDIISINDITKTMKNENLPTYHDLFTFRAALCSRQQNMANVIGCGEYG